MPLNSFRPLLLLPIVSGIYYLLRLQAQKKSARPRGTAAGNIGRGLQMIFSSASHDAGPNDIADPKQTDELVQDRESKYRVLFEDSADAALLLNECGFVDYNTAALRMFGYSNEALMLHPADISPSNQADGSCSRTAAEDRMAAAFRNGKERFEWLHRRKNGEVFPTEVCLTALKLSGRPALLATIRDITDRKHAEEALLIKTALLEAQSETAIDGILVVDESDRIVLANKRFGLIFGIPDEMLGTRDDRIVRKHFADQVENPEAFIERVEYLNRHPEEKSADEVTLKSGKIIERYSAPLVDANGRHRGRIWYFRDITRRKAAEERIQFLAYHDVLTELPHRALLQDRLDSALASARRSNEKVALLFLDLDRFKLINDSLGHLAGDTVLKDAAQRLKDCVRKDDIVARVGGDEFLILLRSIKDGAEAAAVGQRIIQAMTGTFVVDGNSFNMGCSVGVSMFPEHGVDGETLIQNADAAMYSTKKSGGGKVSFFADEMNTRALERLTMDKDLQAALNQEQLFLVYQPQMEIETGRITAFEALIRWQHPTKGLVAPDKFISIAEDNRLILPIGEWVLRAACTQARKWQDVGLPPVVMAVNVSPVQFHEEGFAALVQKVLQETGLSPQYLELELTEGLLLSNADATLSVLHRLKEMGLKLSIDDFGTGYSSLRYLQQLPVDKLKIDRSFVQNAALGRGDAAIATAIISMAKSLQLKVIAEGVETESQLRFLQEHECDEMQGYYLSKPVAAEEASFILQCTQSNPAAGGRQVAAMASALLAC